MPKQKFYDVHTIQTTRNIYRVKAETPEDAEDLALNWPEDCNHIEERIVEEQTIDLVEVG